MKDLMDERKMIYLDDAINRLQEIANDYEDAGNKDAFYVADYCLHHIMELRPAANVAERKRGKWIIHNVLGFNCHRTNRYFAECSECGTLTREWRGILFPPSLRFCTNCGADMREGN